MKEELRALYQEYVEEADRKSKENGWHYEPDVAGFWRWLLIGEIT